MIYTLLLDTSHLRTIAADTVTVAGWPVAQEAAMWAQSLQHSGITVPVRTVAPQLRTHELLALLERERKHR